MGIDSEKDYLDRIATPRIKDILNQRTLFSLKNKRKISVSEDNAEYGLLP